MSWRLDAIHDGGRRGGLGLHKGRAEEANGSFDRVREEQGGVAIYVFMIIHSPLKLKSLPWRDPFTVT